MITSHDIGIVIAYLVRGSFLDELNTKLAAIKVYEVELLLSYILYYLSCHIECSCHLFGIYDY